MRAFLKVLTIVLAATLAWAAEREGYPWKDGKTFEIYYVGGIDSVYSPGQSIRLEVEGRALSTNVPPDPEHGFHVQASIDHEDSSKSLAGANGEYDEGLGGWRVTLEAPRELKQGYRLQASLYCGLDESLCAETYGRAAQVTKTFYFEIR